MAFTLDRRKFLKILGLSSVATGLKPSVSHSTEKLIPYLIPPFEIIPGVANWYASVCRECPAGCGVIVRIREGRAVKIEGNPHHPVNRGRLCARGQAALQGLYNPDRIQQPLLMEKNGQFKAIGWDDAEKILAEKLGEVYREQKGETVAFISELVTGSLEHLIGDWLKALGSHKFFQHEVFSFEMITTANKLTFGEEDIPYYDFERTNLILSFGTDFLETWLSPVAFAKELAVRRTDKTKTLAKFIQIEPRLSLTGANADEWIAIKPGGEIFLALGMIHQIVEEGLPVAVSGEELDRIKAKTKDFTLSLVSEKTGVSEDKIRHLAKSFAEARPGLAIGGGIPSQSSNGTSTLMAINLLNYLVGNVGNTVRFGNKSNYAGVARFKELIRLIEEMREGKIRILLLNNVNILHSLPQSSGFREAIGKVPFVVNFSSYLDDTTEKSHLILPNHTPLESWGDYEPGAGIHGLMQPVMGPIFQTKALGDVLLSSLGKVDENPAKNFPEKSFLDYLKNRWGSLQTKLTPQEDFQSFWEKSLREGGVFRDWQDSKVQLRPETYSLPWREPRYVGPEHESFHLAVYPSMTFFDGRGANKPWLQEQPDSMTQIVGDTWVEVHPETALKLGVKNGDLMGLTSNFGRLEAPVYVYEGVHPQVVAVPLGLGHASYGRYAAGVGANAYTFLSSEIEEESGGHLWQHLLVKAEKLSKRQPLVHVDGSNKQFNRGLVQHLIVSSMNLFMTKIKTKEVGKALHQSLYDEHQHRVHRWGMAIDLQACTGCGACVVACYAENNIPVVGKQRVSRRRIMSWIRIERYFEKRENQLYVQFIPMLCQHCDFAPCEPVCPVHATYHTPEGLNAQVYNRCVGTFYCSNNCPYKVRRFNWFDYTRPEPLNMQLNPDVSVRTKGVMEKCTFCIQRIREKKDLAKDEGRLIRDEEIVPACAQTCPSGAITFGDLKNPDSLVARISTDQRGYHVLEELNTRPSITYLKRVRIWEK